MEKRTVKSTETYQHDDGRLFKLITMHSNRESSFLLPKPCLFALGDVLYSTIIEVDDDSPITRKGVRFEFYTVARHEEDSDTWLISTGGIPGKLVTRSELSLNSRYIMTMDVE